jgi:hypothetical protein
MPIIADKNTRVYFIRKRVAEVFRDGTLSRRNVAEIMGSVYNYFVPVLCQKAPKSLVLSGFVK